MQARSEATPDPAVVRPDIRSGKLDVTGVQLIGTYPIDGSDHRRRRRGAGLLLEERRSRRRFLAVNKVFDAPPATEVQCLNPAFD